MKRAVKKRVGVEDAQETSFLPLTGTEWPEVREHLRDGLDRFINAIEDRSVDGVVSTGIEMQAAFSRILLEAYVIRADGKNARRGS